MLQCLLGMQKTRESLWLRARHLLNNERLNSAEAGGAIGEVLRWHIRNCIHTAPRRPQKCNMIVQHLLFHLGMV